jgi:tetratricopeptide (TPR) repeat protein
LPASADPEHGSGTEQDEIEFQITEAHHDDGDFDREASPKPPVAKEPGAGPYRNDDNELQLGDPDFSQAPFLEPLDDATPAKSSGTDVSAEEFLTGRNSSPESTPKTTEVLDNPDFRPLSKEQVSEIEQRMAVNNNSYLTEEEKRKLIESMATNDQPFSNTPIVPPKRADADHTVPPVVPLVPVVASKDESDTPELDLPTAPRKPAYFYKNYVQLSGDPRLHEHDEVVVGDRAWVLRRKSFNPAMVIAVASPLAALILFFIALQFVGPTNPGDGTMIGMVIDEYAQPFVHGATIRLPEVGKTYTSNPEGFFVTDHLPSGNYRVEWLVEGDVVGESYATVVEGKVTTLTIAPSDELLAELEAENAARSSASQGAAKSTTPTKTGEDSRQAKTNIAQTAQSAAATSPKSSNSGKKQSASTTAGLKLAANIEGAKLTIDGNVLGRGNLTYSKLTPGKHSYKVSADGHETVSGTVTLAAGKTETLKVSLPVLAQADKQEVYTADDFYYSGVNAYKAGDNESAITDLTEAIRLEPSNAKLYLARGDAYGMLRYKDEAHDDYIRAAEIYRFNKKYSTAISAYNNALKWNEGSIAGHMGRASLFLAQSEPVAAITDYETVLRIDRRNFDAYIGLGRARFEQGNYKKAIKAFKDARSVDGQNPVAYQFLMLAYMADNDIDEVQKSYKKFAEVASSEDMARMRKDQTYSAVLRVVDKN